MDWSSFVGSYAGWEDEFYRAEPILTRRAIRETPKMGHEVVTLAGGHHRSKRNKIPESFPAIAAAGVVHVDVPPIQEPEVKMGKVLCVPTLPNLCMLTYSRCLTETWPFIFENRTAFPSSICSSLSLPCRAHQPRLHQNQDVIDTNIFLQASKDKIIARPHRLPNLRLWNQSSPENHR